MASKLPKEAYAFVATMFGCEGPVKVTKGAGDALWTKDGTREIEKMGLHQAGGWLTYCSADRAKVATFAEGYRAAQFMLMRNFVRGLSRASFANPQKSDIAPQPYRNSR